MRLKHILALVPLLAAAMAARADMLDINLNNNTAQFQFSTAGEVNAQGNADIHGGILYNNNKSMLFNIGLMEQNTLAGAPGLSAGVGLEAVIAKVKDNPPVTSNVSALAVDGLLRYSPPGADLVGIAGEIHYSPKILTYGDAVRYMQGTVRLEYEIAAQTMVYVGYRRISFGIKDTRAAVMDSGVHIGFRLAF